MFATWVSCLYSNVIELHCTVNTLLCNYIISHFYGCKPLCTPSLNQYLVNAELKKTLLFLNLLPRSDDHFPSKAMSTFCCLQWTFTKICELQTSSWKICFFHVEYYIFETLNYVNDFSPSKKREKYHRYFLHLVFTCISWQSDIKVITATLKKYYGLSSLQKYNYEPLFWQCSFHSDHEISSVAYHMVVQDTHFFLLMSKQEMKTEIVVCIGTCSSI